MNATTLEGLVLSLAHQCRTGSHVEDSRLEFKLEWPGDFAKAARRIAGHCNAMRGDWIAWVIGLHEDGQAKDSSGLDAATWYAAIAKRFDGIAPDLLQVIKVPWNGVVLTVLQFDSGRAPYICKNPSFGNKDEAVELEIPWREGTRVRSARREEVVRLLWPIAQSPVVDVVRASLSLRQETPEHLVCCEGYITAYVATGTAHGIVLPLHRMCVRVRDAMASDWLELRATIDIHPQFLTRTAAIQVSDTEVCVNGAGSFTLSLYNSERCAYRPFQAPVELELQMVALPRTRVDPVSVLLQLGGNAANHQQWHYQAESYKA